MSIREVTNEDAKVVSLAVDKTCNVVFVGSGRASSEMGRGTLVRLDLANDKSRILFRTAESVSHVSFSPNYEIIAAHGGSRESKIWFLSSDALSDESKEYEVKFGIPITDQVHSGRFTPNGNYFLCATREGRKKTVVYSLQRYLRMHCSLGKAIPDR